MKILWFNEHTGKIKQNAIISCVGDDLEKQIDILSVTQQSIWMWVVENSDLSFNINK